MGVVGQGLGLGEALGSPRLHTGAWSLLEATATRGRHHRPAASFMVIYCDDQGKESGGSEVEHQTLEVEVVVVVVGRWKKR